MVAPGESPVPPAEDSVAPGVDLATPPADFDLSTPAFGLTPAAFDFAAPPAPDTPAGQDPGLTATPPDSLTQEDLGFAAAPVPTDHATAPAAEQAPEGGSPPVAPADPSYIWDLAATDVFPAAGPVQPSERSGAPEASPADTVPPPPEDSPGDGGK
jgi:hypothetical protein